MTTWQNQYRITTAASQRDCRRQVVNERNEKLNIFSKEGIRGDMVVAFFIVVFILLFGLLSMDISMLSTTGSSIRNAFSRIEALKSQNEQYRMDIALAEEHPVLSADPDDQSFRIWMTVPDSNVGLK